MPARDRRRPFWSKWVWKDWIAKTQDLSPVEYTAYHRLLGYAATCSSDLCSIPEDDVRLARATGLGLKAWLRVRDRVLEFFPRELPAGNTSTAVEALPRRRSHRLLADASRFLQLVAANTERVNRRLPSGSHLVAPFGNYARGGQKLEVRSKKKSKDLEPNTCPPAVGVGVQQSLNGQPTADPKAEWLEAFDRDFYPGYPRKAKPDDARKAWMQMKPWSQGNCDAIFAGLSKWISWWASNSTPKDKIPYPASFLRSGQWKGDPE